MRRTDPAEIRDTLASLDIPRNRVVIVHSSLLKFGFVAGGAKAIVDVLFDVLGPETTLAMPAFSLTFGETRYWKSDETKSEMGALTEHFRRMPETRRSLHPFHSVAAMGPETETLVSGLCRTSFGPGSAFDKLYDLDALNLFIGTEFVGGATFLHMGEERANVPYRYMKDFPGEVYDADGNLVDETFAMFVRSMTDAYEYNTDWSEWWRDFQAHDCFRTADLGGAMFCVSEIRRTLDIFADLIEADPFRHSHAYPRRRPA